MKFRMINYRKIFQRLRLSLLPLLIAAPLHAAQPAQNSVTPVTVAPSPAKAQALLQAQLAWQKSLIATARPGSGCYMANYPDTGLTQIPCGKAVTAPQIVPRGRPRPLTVGNGADAALNVNGTLTSATGSFDAVIGVTSLTPGTDPTNTYTSASDFSLQMNTNRFSTSLCSGAKVPSSCQGWVQYLYSNTGSLYIEYTVIGWNQSMCPTNYSPYPPALGGTANCYYNTTGSPVPVQALSNLANLTLTGMASNGGNDEAIIATSTHQMYFNTFADSELGLGTNSNWNGVEYNIVGDQNGTQTNFNPSGVLLNVRITVLDLNSTPPTCATNFTGFTGETNNLNLEPNCEQQSNGIIFSETNLAVAINSISPTSGPQAGGTPVILNGTGFTQNMEAGFGSDYIGIQGDCPTSTQCTVYSPRATRPGPVTIIVGGTSQGAPFSTPTANAVFNYVATPPAGTLSPATGVPAGGTALTIGMTNFDAFQGSKVEFDFNGKTTEIDDATCALNPVNGANSYCTLQTPPLPATISPPAAVPVSVDYNGEIVAVGSFTYQNPPPLPVMDPDTGYITGNTAITLNLANFIAGADSVVDFDFNGTMTPASGVSCTVAGGDSTCTLKDPPFPGGTLPAAIPVSITSGGKTLAVSDFTYRRPTLSFCQQCAVSGGKCMLVNGKWTCSTGCIRSSPTGVCQ